MAGRRGVPVIAVAGSLGEGCTEVHDHGIDAAMAITCEPMGLDEASSRAGELVEAATEQALRFMRVGAAVFGHPPDSSLRSEGQ